jgi:hypothetical protein
MMIRITIAQDNPYLEELQFQLAKLGAGSMPRTAEAMAKGAGFIQETWRGFAKGGPLPGITEPLKRPSGTYARSIRSRRNGPFDYEIYSNSKIAELIENGTEELDMKKTHPYGPRSRVSKKGVPYLIVPFRWGTPKTIGFKNVMPEAVYNMIKNKKQFRQSRVTVSANKADAAHTTPNAQVPRKIVGRAQYKWGTRLTGIGYVDHRRHVEGMVSMEGQVEGGKKRASGYFTFRVISANSPATSWIKPAMPPRHVTKAVVEQTREAVNAMVETAIREDLGV